MTDAVRRPVDPWNESAITGAEEPQARELARLLELRGQADDQVALRNTYLDLLRIRAGEHVLDIGGGTGVVTREVARRVSPHGRVVGLDPVAALDGWRIHLGIGDQPTVVVVRRQSLESCRAAHCDRRAQRQSGPGRLEYRFVADDKRRLQLDPITYRRCH
jgi:SAM-dependent methyltransferase